MKSLMKRLEKIHLYFGGQREKEAIHDFMSCLKKRLRKESNFANAYEKAVDDLGNEKEVSEAYDKSTLGWIRNCMPFISEKTFGKDIVAVS